MGQELSDAEWLRNFANFIEEADGDDECDGSILADSEDSIRLRSIADRLERPAVDDPKEAMLRAAAAIDSVGDPFWRTLSDRLRDTAKSWDALQRR